MYSPSFGNYKLYFLLTGTMVNLDLATFCASIYANLVYSGNSFRVFKLDEEKKKFANDHIIIYDNFQQAPPAEVIEVVKFDNFFDKGTKDEHLWSDIAKLCGYDNVQEFLENFFAHKTISQWTQVYNEEVAPRIVEALLEGTISIVPFGSVDFTPTAKYHGGSYLMRLNLALAPRRLAALRTCRASGLTSRRL